MLTSWPLKFKFVPSLFLHGVMVPSDTLMTPRLSLESKAYLKEGRVAIGPVVTGESGLLTAGRGRRCQDAIIFSGVNCQSEERRTIESIDSICHGVIIVFV